MSGATSARVEHRVAGPLELAVSDEARLAVVRVVFAYAPAPRLTPRRWTLDVVVAGIQRQSLVALFDTIEDEAPLVSAAQLDPRVATDALDLRNYEFSSAIQAHD